MRSARNVYDSFPRLTARSRLTGNVSLGSTAAVRYAQRAVFPDVVVNSSDTDSWFVEVTPIVPAAQRPVHEVRDQWHEVNGRAAS